MDARQEKRMPLSRRARSAATPLLASAAALALSGCVPNLGPRPQPVGAASLASANALAAPAAPWPEQGWWHAYDDPQLDALIAEALAASPDLRAADARARRAAALAEREGAAADPQVDLNGRPEIVRNSRNLGYPDFIRDQLPRGLHSQARLTLDFSYDLDLFGRNRAALSAATSEAEAAAIDAAAARLYLSTAIAANYADLRRLLDERAAMADALRLRRESLGLYRQRFAQGLGNRVELDQQAGTVPVAEGELAAIDGQILATRHLLAALLAAGPDRGLAIEPPTAAPLRPFGVPETLRLELVGRRPDLVAARRRAEAAGSRIDMVRADFYPNVNLTAFAGVQSFGIAGLFTKDALTGSAGPAISLPIFNRHRLRGAYRGAGANYDEAVAEYDRLLVDALRDIADILARERAVGGQADAAARAEADATSAYDGIRQRYVAGLATYFEVLGAETVLIERRRSVAALKAQSLLIDIALVRALGGGFAAPQPARN